MEANRRAKTMTIAPNTATAQLNMMFQLHVRQWRTAAARSAAAEQCTLPRSLASRQDSMFVVYRICHQSATGALVSCCMLSVYGLYALVL